MHINRKVLSRALPASLLCASLWGGALPAGPAIDAKVHTILERTHAHGMAVALIDNGAVRYAAAYGERNAKGDPLTVNTVMYGASLTKTVFAYTVYGAAGRPVGKPGAPATVRINRETYRDLLVSPAATATPGGI